MYQFDKEKFDPHSHDIKKALENTRNSIVLGVLANGMQYYPQARDPQPISMNQKETGILMYIKPISPEPDIIVQLDNTLSSPLYIGRPREHLGNHIPPTFKYAQTMDKQIEILKQKFDNRIIAFRPRITYLDFRVFKNFEIISSQDEWANDTQYEPVPKITNKNTEGLDSAILNGEVIVLDDFEYNWSGPQYVICENYLYHFKNGWEYVGNKQWKPLNAPGVMKATVDWVSHFIFAKESLMFLETKYLSDIATSIWEPIRKIEAISVSEDQVGDAQISSGKATPLSTIKQAEKPSVYDEHQFLQHLWNLTRQNGLYYSMDTLVNFHISVKTNAVTILSGMSGTGKTQLALLYAEALGLYIPKAKAEEEKNRLLVIPINPGYTEPEDISGHLNASTGLFSPSDTGFVDLLIQASKDPDNMYMVIFDEMNLSQVEYWFAPFLSRLELTEDLRELQLYSKNQICHNKSEYPSKIQLGDNLLFVGTANMDETTRSFSDRLLDRVNVVIPEKMSFKDFYNAKNNNDDYGSDASDKYRNKNIYRQWVYGGDVWSAFSADEMDFFESLHRIINEVDSQKGVSFRSLKKIAEFIKGIPVSEENKPYLERREVIDLQIKQRILTKIRGSSEQFRELIGVVSSNGHEGEIASRMYQHFTCELARDISDFTLTLKEIRRKARELHMYDYAT